MAFVCLVRKSDVGRARALQAIPADDPRLTTDRPLSTSLRSSSARSCDSFDLHALVFCLLQRHGGTSGDGLGCSRARHGRGSGLRRNSARRHATRRGCSYLSSTSKIQQSCNPSPFRLVRASDAPLRIAVAALIPTPLVSHAFLPAPRRHDVLTAPVPSRVGSAPLLQPRPPPQPPPRRTGVGRCPADDRWGSVHGAIEPTSFCRPGTASCLFTARADCAAGAPSYPEDESLPHPGVFAR